jgi:hypothetical protein
VEPQPPIYKLGPWFGNGIKRRPISRKEQIENELLGSFASLGRITKAQVIDRLVPCLPERGKYPSQTPSRLSVLLVVIDEKPRQTFKSSKSSFISMTVDHNVDALGTAGKTSLKGK